jgi:hypothetical protein
VSNFWPQISSSEQTTKSDKAGNKKQTKTNKQQLINATETRTTTQNKQESIKHAKVTTKRTAATPSPINISNNCKTALVNKAEQRTKHGKTRVIDAQQEENATKTIYLTRSSSILQTRNSNTNELSSQILRKHQTPVKRTSSVKKSATCGTTVTEEQHSASKKKKSCATTIQLSSDDDEMVQSKQVDNIMKSKSHTVKRKQDNRVRERDSSKQCKAFVIS